MRTNRRFFKIQVKTEQISLACTGVFLIVVGSMTLFLGQQASGRMMLLLGLCSCVWGTAALRDTIQNTQSMKCLLRGLFFTVFGAAILLSNLAGVLFSSRVLGTMLFLYGAVPIALVFSQQNLQPEQFFFCLPYAIYGCVLVLFSGQRGMLCAICVMLCGVHLTAEAVSLQHKFVHTGETKDMQTSGR